MAFAWAAVEAADDQWDVIQAIDALLAVLESKKVGKVSFDTMLCNHTLVWQIKVFQQVALHRIVGLANGCMTMWKSRDIYGAALFARAMLETTAIVHDLSHRLEFAVDNRDLLAARDLLANRTFGSHPDRRSKNTSAATNIDILTIMSQLDQQYPGTLTAYRHLSEMCSPVSLGPFSMSVIIDRDTGDATFDNFEHYKKTMFDCVIIACALLRAFEHALQNIHNTALSLSSAIN